MQLKVWRWLGFLLGLALVAGAIVAAAGQIDWTRIASAPIELPLALAAAVLLNLLLTGLLFWVVTLSFDARPPVGLWRMTELLAASGLLNYLPLRPGLLGRTVYLKVRHGLPIRQSLWIMVIILTLGLLALAASVVPVILAKPAQQATALSICLLTLLALAPLAGPVGKWLLKRPLTGAWSWIPLRMADMLVAGLRLWLAMRIVGEPITFPQALAAGAAGVVTVLISVTPNGLGLREWVIAAAAALLVPHAGAAALAASLVDRAVEALMLALAGGVALWHLSALDWRSAKKI